jgi:hypothetical protein
MTDNDNRRLSIFDKYATHLQMLVDSGTIKQELKYDVTYICPVCTRQFNKEDLDQEAKNPLTLEDAPPKSLGGRANILTCRECNNGAGQQIDFHLTARMNELDQHQFVPGVEFHPEFDHNGTIVQGTVKVNEDGVIDAAHAVKKNNPQKLGEYIAATGKEEVINIKFRDSKVDIFRLQLALLKTAYLMTFEKYGYSFILNPIYDRLRDQLRNPNKEIYPVDSWFQAEYYKPYKGVPLATGKGVETIFPIFVLNTGLTERTFAYIIPLTNRPVEELLEQVSSLLKEHKGFLVEMDAMTGADYLFDINAIHKMLKWIDKLSKDEVK